jgi:lipopolysaccharide transport system ATP-binding protein
MSDTVIQVENLAKRYILAHQAQGSGRYKRFSDVLVNAAKAPFRSLQKRGQSNPEREEFWALRDVSFEIGRGEVVGIIGRNGAGKSTLLKILSRITEPTSGSIEIEGRVASLLEVGTGFHPELTGRENIYLNGAILGMTRREIKKKFDEIVAFAEVEKFLDTPVRFYSSGMYVRLAFAVAAHLEPEILIIDEVLAVGDAQFQKKCLGKMQDVSTKEGRTVLFVSHQMGVIASLCKKCVVLEKGRTSFIGDVQSAIQRYLGSTDIAPGHYQADPAKMEEGGNRILSIQVESFEGVPRSEFAFTESICLSIRLALPHPMADLVLAIGFDNHQQSRVFTLIRDVSAFKRVNDESLIKIRLPGALIAPNRYSFTLALFQVHSPVQDFLQNVCPIYVFDDGSPLSRFEGVDIGSVIIDAKWIG